ncbi:cytochrome c3 family protein [Segatella oulorum]
METTRLRCCACHNPHGAVGQNMVAASLHRLCVAKQHQHAENAAQR